MAEMDELNEFINSELGYLFQEITPRTPSFRYFSDKKKNRYFWTTEPTLIEGKKRFTSGVYRYFKTKKQFHLKKRVNHATRTGAKKRALRLYQKSKGAD